MSVVTTVFDAKANIVYRNDVSVGKVVCLDSISTFMTLENAFRF